MKKLDEQNSDINNIRMGSSYASIVIKTSLHKLLDVLGSPTRIGSGDNKVQLEWIYYNPNQTKDANYECLRIYDWKTHTPIYNISEWHVGAKNISKKEIMRELMELGFLRDEEIIDY